MAVRHVDRTAKFARSLKGLSKRHPDLNGAIITALARYATSGPTKTSQQIPRLKGAPVFKDRLAFGNRGQRGGARIIYYCDAECVMAMFLYLKGEQEDVPVNEIWDALKQTGLYSAPEDSNEYGAPPGNSSTAPKAIQ